MLLRRLMYISPYLNDICFGRVYILNLIMNKTIQIIITGISINGKHADGIGVLDVISIDLIINIIISVNKDNIDNILAVTEKNNPHLFLIYIAIIVNTIVISGI